MWEAVGSFGVMARQTFSGAFSHLYDPAPFTRR
jgi:hypothetical protein